MSFYFGDHHTISKYGVHDSCFILDWHFQIKTWKLTRSLWLENLMLHELWWFLFTSIIYWATITRCMCISKNREEGVTKVCVPPLIVGAERNQGCAEPSCLRKYFMHLSLSYLTRKQIAGNIYFSLLGATKIHCWT